MYRLFTHSTAWRCKPRHAYHLAPPHLHRLTAVGCAGPTFSHIKPQRAAKLFLHTKRRTSSMTSKPATTAAAAATLASTYVTAGFGTAAAAASGAAKSLLKYCSDLRAPIQTAVNREPRAPVHRVEWSKVRHLVALLAIA